jgi:glycerophosphoryl diester phosphodiesterase
MMRLWLLGLFIMLIAGGISAQEDNEDRPVFRQHDDTLVIAHQGGDGLRPGNTMAAFEHAVELGVDVLEMDVHATADGVLVVIHDDTVDRTTDGTGRVQDLTFDEIQALDAGYDWPTLPDTGIEGHPYRGEGVTIPALEEVLQAFPEMPMVIELKQEEPSIVEPFCEMLRDYEMTEQVVMASFHESTMLEFREACPEVMTSGVEPEIRDFWLRSRGGREDGFDVAMAAFQVPEYAGSLHVVDEDFVAAARTIGVEVHVWTVNERDQMERMIELGVDGIITDYPDQVIDLLSDDAG